MLLKANYIVMMSMKLSLQQMQVVKENLVARWIIDKAKVNKPIKRLWISSVTDKAIKEGFANLKPWQSI